MKFITVFLLSVLLLTACSGDSTTTSEEIKQDDAPTVSENPDVVASTDEGSDKDAVESEDIKPKSKDAKASREEITAKDAATKGLGPTDTVRAFNDAIIQKDAARIKALLSRASMASIEANAKRIGKTVDEILTTEGGGPMPAEREMQNEKIEGDKASVEVKNTVLGSFDNFYLVKEDGNWRVDFVKMEQEAIKKLNEMQKNAPIPNG